MKRITRAVCVLLGVSALGAHATEDDVNFRSDVLACEAAVAALAVCCPGFRPKELRCTYLEERDPGPSCHNWSTTVTTEPALTQDDSECILAASCDELRAGKTDPSAGGYASVCVRAQHATEAVTVYRSNGIESPSGWRAPAAAANVCP
jgi:hypothetical protein